MKVFKNIITGKEIVAKTLHHIPGNIVNRGLAHEYIIVDVIALEYQRLIKQLELFTERNYYGTGYKNTVLGLTFLKTKE